MKIHICKDNKVFPFLYIDNWYSPEEEKLIWRELDFYTIRSPMLFHRAEKDPATGKYLDGTTKSKAHRIYIDTLYRRRDASHLLRLHPLKMASEEVQNAIKAAGPNFRVYGQTNCDTTMLNYYEDHDYYASHSDIAMMTSICWFHRKPKAYTGGNLTFKDIKFTLECKHNRLVLFPGYYFHQVDAIKMKKKKEIGWGRYAIENFYNTVNTPLK